MISQPMMILLVVFMKGLIIISITNFVFILQWAIISFQRGSTKDKDENENQCHTRRSDMRGV